MTMETRGDEVGMNGDKRGRGHPSTGLRDRHAAGVKNEKAQAGVPVPHELSIGMRCVSPLDVGMTGEGRGQDRVNRGIGGRKAQIAQSHAKLGCVV
jgi:hypothetical protein